MWEHNGFWVCFPLCGRTIAQCSVHMFLRAQFNRPITAIRVKIHLLRGFDIDRRASPVRKFMVKRGFLISQIVSLAVGSIMRLRFSAHAPADGVLKEEFTL